MHTYSEQLDRIVCPDKLTSILLSFLSEISKN